MTVVPCTPENGHVVVFDGPIRVGVCGTVFESDKVFLDKPFTGRNLWGQFNEADELFGVFGWDAHNVRMV